MAETVQYIDWSDDSAYEKYLNDGSTAKYGTIEYEVDESDPSPDLHLHIRRDTKSRRDFTLLLSSNQLRALYDKLKEVYGE